MTPQPWTLSYLNCQIARSIGLVLGQIAKTRPNDLSSQLQIGLPHFSPGSCGRLQIPHLDFGKGTDLRTHDAQISGEPVARSGHRGQPGNPAGTGCRESMICPSRLHSWRV
jgi:hypothetical protein